MLFAIFLPGVEEKVEPGRAHSGDVVTKLCPAHQGPEHVSWGFRLPSPTQDRAQASFTALQGYYIRPYQRPATAKT